MRRTSVSLPTKHIAHDPHEKRGRYGLDHRDTGLIARMQSSWATQSQRARYIKTSAIVFLVIFLFYFFSPSGVDLYKDGTFPPDRSYSLTKNGIEKSKVHNCSQFW
jgi:guanosine-diphosphatase